MFRPVPDRDKEDPVQIKMVFLTAQHYEAYTYILNRCALCVQTRLSTVEFDIISCIIYRYYSTLSCFTAENLSLRLWPTTKTSNSSSKAN